VLSDDERLALWRAVAEAVTVPVLAGSGSNDTRHSVELTKAASDTGVDGILCVTRTTTAPPKTPSTALLGGGVGDRPAVVLYESRCAPAGASPRRRCCAWRATSPTSWPLRTQPVT